MNDAFLFLYSLSCIDIKQFLSVKITIDYLASIINKENIVIKNLKIKKCNTQLFGTSAIMYLCTTGPIIIIWIPNKIRKLLLLIIIILHIIILLQTG